MMWMHDLAVSTLTPPKASQKQFKDTHHGITRKDEYAWLRDDNWQAVMKCPAALAAEIRSYIEAENNYTEAVMSQTGDLRHQLFAELKSRLQEDESTPPAPLGDWAWFTKFTKGGEHPQICRIPHIPRSRRDEQSPEIIIDGNIEAEGEAYFKIAGTAPSPTQALLAWSVDVKGSEYFSIRFRDIATGQDLTDTIPDTAGNMAWSADSTHLFYIRVDENHRPNQVMRHKRGTPTDEDVLVYQETDPGFFVSLSAARSGDFIFIDIHDHETSEVRLIDTHNPEAQPRLVVPRTHRLEYQLSHDAARDRFLILTNHQGAEDFKIMSASVTSPNAWEELIPHRQGALILDVAAYAGHMVWVVRENALPSIHLQCLKTLKVTDISFDEEAYEVSLDAGLEYDTPFLRFIYASMTTPRQTFDFNMATAKRKLVHEQIVPSGHNPENYVTRRIWAQAEDGERIPISLLYHKDTPLDGTAQTLLYGYGSYGITIPASFSASRYSLVDRGFIYAIAHIRGSKAMGHNWFLQGRGKTKKNSFSDFVASAKALISQGFTKEKQISIHGGSAGGLLVGATLNLAPELFAGAIAEVPFVDVLTTMLDDSLPLTPPEWPEWGNPISSEEEYKTIAAYSPYDNIRESAYPHILATGGLTDPRVTYWEPTKWVARLRDKRTDDGLTLLNIEMKAGHGGKAGRFNQLQEIALVYAFIIMVHDKSDRKAS